MGFSTAIAIHILFDLFPYKWKGGALLKIPFNNITCSKETTKLFFIVTILVSEFLSVFYMTDLKEYFFIIILSIFIFIKKIPYEKIFVRPCLIFLISILVLGSLKFPELFLFFRKIMI